MSAWALKAVISFINDHFTIFITLHGDSLVIMMVKRQGAIPISLIADYVKRILLFFNHFKFLKGLFSCLLSEIGVKSDEFFYSFSYYNASDVN